MKSKVRKFMVALAAIICCTGVAVGATIQYVADNATGIYGVEGVGISVSVSAPTSGYTVKYAESSGGPWLSSLKYTNVCNGKLMYFQITRR